MGNNEVAQNTFLSSKKSYPQNEEKPLKALTFKGFFFVARGGLE